MSTSTFFNSCQTHTQPIQLKRKLTFQPKSNTNTKRTFLVETPLVSRKYKTTGVLKRWSVGCHGNHGFAHLPTCLLCAHTLRDVSQCRLRLKTHFIRPYIPDCRRGRHPLLVNRFSPTLASFATPARSSTQLIGDRFRP